jgi:hypothetical protein
MKIARILCCTVALTLLMAAPSHAAVMLFGGLGQTTLDSEAFSDGDSREFGLYFRGEKWGLSLAYLDLGNFELYPDVLAPEIEDLFAQALAQEPDLEYLTSIQGVNTQLVYSHPLAERLRVEAAVGLFYRSARLEEQRGGRIDLIDSYEGNDLNASLGVSYELTRKLSLQAKASMFTIVQINANSISAGVSLRF